MSRVCTAITLTVLLTLVLSAQRAAPCACGATPLPRPVVRTAEPYAGTPTDMRPFTKFTEPYFNHYTSLVEYNGPARDVPVPPLSELDAVNIGFLGPIEYHIDEARGRMMLHGANMAIDEANTNGGYGGKPFRLMVHNDQALWGASSNEIVKMVYDEKVWGILGSIAGDSTHIALRVALKIEIPIVNSAATDPTIPETIIPWYLTVIQDDRVQGYTLARRIYTDLGFKRVAILRINDRYGRFGVGKLKDAARRLGHPIVIEQKYMGGDTDFARQLRVIDDSKVDAIVLWSDAEYAGAILKQMRAMGMKQRVFGGYRVLGDALFKIAGADAEGLEFVYPYDPTREDPSWRAFIDRFQKRFSAFPDAFASLGYDAMKILLDSVCRAGLNRGAIRDALTSVEHYRGVTGEMTFDPNVKNVAPLYLGVIKNGRAEYRRYSMDKPYAKVGEGGVGYNGPGTPDLPAGTPVVAVFGPHAAELSGMRDGFRLVGIDSEAPWGKASTDLVSLLYNEHTLGIIATDRKAAHLALQLANKIEMPVLAVTDDRTLTSINLPWIFRLPASTATTDALRCLFEAVGKSGPNRARLRQVLASGTTLLGRLSFETTGEPRQ